MKFQTLGFFEMHCVLVTDGPLVSYSFAMLDNAMSASGGGYSRYSAPRLTVKNIKQRKKKETKRRPVNVRKEFPETWLWTEEIFE